MEGTSTRFAVADSCGAIEAFVAPYIEGLVAEDNEPFTEWGGVCNWSEPDTATHLSEIRSVEVGVSLQTGETVDSISALRSSDFFTLVEAPAIAQADGIAHTISIDTVAKVIVTSVLVPDVTVTISGGRWEAAPPLDAAAAVVVAQRVLGL